MQKVVGSNPIIRSKKNPRWSGGFCLSGFALFPRSVGCQQRMSIFLTDALSPGGVLVTLGALRNIGGRRCPVLELERVDECYERIASGWFPFR